MHGCLARDHPDSTAYVLQDSKACCGSNGDALFADVSCAYLAVCLCRKT